MGIPCYNKDSAMNQTRDTELCFLPYLLAYILFKSVPKLTAVYRRPSFISYYRRHRPRNLPTSIVPPRPVSLSQATKKVTVELDRYGWTRSMPIDKRHMLIKSPDLFSAVLFTWDVRNTASQWRRWFFHIVRSVFGKCWYIYRDDKVAYAK